MNVGFLLLLCQVLSMTWGYVLKLRTEVLSDSITMKNAKLLEMFMQKLMMLKNQTSRLESQV